MHDLPQLVFNNGFKFQDSVCSGCHNLTMLSVNISYIAIITIRNIDYRCIIHNMINIGAVIRNPEMLTFVHDHLKTNL